MKIQTLVLGILDTNCYILKKDKCVLVIDPADNYEKIKEEIKNYNLVGVLITHHHFDHVGALSYFDKNLIYDNNNLLEKEYELGPFKFNVIKTYGHTDDSLTYYFREDNVMFVGDFIFKESIGRCDLPTGNFNIMKKSIEKIKAYPDNVVLYPGHDEYTTLGYEKINNPYF